MLDHLLYLSGIVLITVCALFALVFVCLPMPNNKLLGKYRRSLWATALAYLMVAVFNIAELLFGITSVDFISSTFIGICLTQATLFTITLENLLNPQKITNSFILKHSIPFAAFIALHAVLVPMFGYPMLDSYHALNTHIWHPVVILRLVFLAVYVVQFVFYSHMLFMEEKRYNEQILNFSADTTDIQLHWVKYGFVFAVAVGVCAIFTTLHPGAMFILLFNLLLIVFYTFFGIRFISYPHVFESIKNMFEPALPVSAEASTEEYQKTDSAKRYNWEELKLKIQDHKLHLQPGITIDEIASQIGIGRSMLSALINSEESVNFNMWINKLRICEAKRLLLEEEHITLSEVAERVGYTEQSNFSRQFKAVTNLTPTAWKKSLC